MTVMTTVSILSNPGVEAIARKLLDGNSDSAIVARIHNPFGTILVFTDVSARDAYQECVGKFKIKGEDVFPLEIDDAVVIMDIVWGQQ